MIKKIALVLVVVIAMALLGGTANAYFTDNTGTKVIGRTGDVEISSASKVMLPNDMQPGHLFHLF